MAPKQPSTQYEIELAVKVIQMRREIKGLQAEVAKLHYDLAMALEEPK